MQKSGSKQKSTVPKPLAGKAQLSLWKVELDGDWSRGEIDRIIKILNRLIAEADGKSISELLNNQQTTLHHSGRPGRVGHTRGADVYLDKDWTDWTLAHELGHRWNNAWKRQPEKRLRKTLRAGRLEWLMKGLRRFEKWLERALKPLEFKGHLDWHKLWYQPGDAPPPCGVDRNFNASEDLAESFAAIIFQENAQNRSRRAVKRLGAHGQKWNWPAQFLKFSETPRGQVMLRLLKNLVAEEEYPYQTNHPAAQN